VWRSATWALAEPGRSLGAEKLPSHRCSAPLRRRRPGFRPCRPANAAMCRWPAAAGSPVRPWARRGVPVSLAPVLNPIVLASTGPPSRISPGCCWPGPWAPWCGRGAGTSAGQRSRSPAAHARSCWRTRLSQPLHPGSLLDRGRRIARQPARRTAAAGRVPGGDDSRLAGCWATAARISCLCLPLVFAA